MSSLDVVVLGELGGNTGDLRPEASRVKAALLYGDKIAVKSYKVPFLLGSIAAKARLLPRAIKEAGAEKAFLRQLTADLESEGVSGNKRREALLDLLRSDEPQALFELGETTSAIVRDGGGLSSEAYFQATAPLAVESYLRDQPVNDRAGMLAATGELIRLTESGIVEVDTAGSQDMVTSDLHDVRRVFDQSLSLAIETFTFDPLEHQLFTAGPTISINKVDRTGSPESPRTTRAELAASMLTDIPSFPTASVDEILDIRERVAPHLRRFRAAVADLEGELNAGVGSENFAAEVEDLKLRRVEPEMEELRESLRDEGIGRTASRSIPYLASGVLGLGASLAVGAPTLAGVIAVSAGATTAAAKEIVERAKLDGERKRHRLFLLFDVERQLARGKSP